MTFKKLTRRSYFSPRMANSKKLVGLAAFIAIAGAVLLTPGDARAQLTFSFAQPVQSMTTGTTIDFFASIANTGTEQIFINGFNPGLTASGITITDLFFANVPDTFQPGDNGLYKIFSVTADSGATPGAYVGLAQIDYETPTLVDQVATQTYTINVAAATVPEPSSAAGMVIGLLSFATSFAGYRIQRRKANKEAGVFG